jgi:hypothetical protein
MTSSTLDIPFQINNPWAFPVHGMPLRCSVPFPQGHIKDPAAELMLLDEKGADMAAQWRVLSKWKDGSARFALMDYAEADVPPRTAFQYRLQARDQKKAGVPRKAIRVRETSDSLTVDTGRLAWTFSKRHFSFAESIVAHGRDWVKGQASDLVTTDAHGQKYRASEGEYHIELEENGPYRVVVRVQGDHRNPVGRFMNYWIRFHFVAGGSQVLMIHHVRNRESGREGRDLRCCRLEGALNVGPRAVRRLVHTQRTVNTIQGEVEVPENVDIDISDLKILLRNGASLRENPDDICGTFKPYGEIPGGNRAVAPLIDLYEPEAGGMLFAFAAPNPALEAPMRLGSERNRFEIDMFPDTGECIHLNEGMGKTRDVLLNFHDGKLGMMDLFHDSNHVSYPGVVGVPHEVYRASQFADIHLTLVRQPNKYPMLETKIEFMKSPGDIANKQSIKAHPLTRQALGWQNFGDYVGLRGYLPMVDVVQYGNNEEDYVYCAMLDAWRTGRPYDGRDNARHVMDIDFIDFSTDPGRNGATCPHSTHHTDGEVYTSHQWCQGLLYYYLATGDEEALRISRRIGDCLVWWITGPRSIAVRGSGRETAWPLLSLSALFEVTGETRYRDAALQVVDGLIAVQKQYGRVVWEYPLGSGIFSDYMIAMSFNGIWDVWAATGEARVLQLWKDITQPIVAALEDPNSKGYVHFRNAHLIWADLTVLVRWYGLTGDRKYVDLGRNGLRMILAACPEPFIQSDSIFAMGYRHFILFLKLADEFGMIDDDHVTLVW